MPAHPDIYIDRSEIGESQSLQDGTKETGILLVVE